MTRFRIAPADWRLSAESLSVRRGRRIVVHDVDLAIRPDECIALIGPNGAGKTTLLLALLGLLPPERGVVKLNDRALHRLPAAARGRFGAYVPQIVERIPAFRVYDVVAAGRFPHVHALRPLSDEDQRIVRAAIEHCGLADLAERPANAVSGGERQKMLLAAAIAQDARVLFLDEPTTALDPAYQVALVQMLHAWRRDGRAIVLVSHDLQLPAAMGGRIVALRDGRIVADGPAESILEPARLADIYGTSFELARTESGRVVCVPKHP